MARLKDAATQIAPALKVDSKQKTYLSFYLKEYANIPMIEISHDINFVPNLSRIKTDKRVDIGESWFRVGHGKVIIL